MKNNILKYYIAVFYLCSTCVMFSQATNNSTLDLEGDDSAGVPVDGGLTALLVGGAIYGAKKLKERKK